MLSELYNKFLMTDSLKFKKDNFFLFDVPLIFFPSDLFLDLLKKNNEQVNKSLYYSFKVSLQKHLAKRFEKESELRGEKLFRFLLQLFSSSGWGHFSLMDFDKKKNRAIVVVKNSPFALNVNSKEPVDHLHRGIIAAIFSECFKKDFDCVELKCQAQPQEKASNCEFIVKLSKNFNKKQTLTKKQL